MPETILEPFEGECPTCHSRSLDLNTFESEDGTIYRCVECGLEFIVLPLGFIQPLERVK